MRAVGRWWWWFTRISPVPAMNQVERSVVMGMTGEPDGPR
jgi:hypothetical protein